jgi:O-acetylserine/cysteine efflux transporter
VPQRPHNTAIAISLVFAIFLWGGNNAGTKFIVGSWPPVWTGASRFLLAGLILLAILRFTRFLGTWHTPDRELSRALWIRGGLSLAVYIVTFNTALRFTGASNVAVYLGAAPIWALLWEKSGPMDWRALHRYGAALLAFSGVLVLFWPNLKIGGQSWIGDLLAFCASFLWTNYGRQCRFLASDLSGAEVSAHTMWRAGVLLAPLAAIEAWHSGLSWSWPVLGVQAYCITFGGVGAFAIWSRALRYWPASQVLLFNNLIPLSTLGWAHFWLGERITHRFWAAMVLVLGGVLLGQLKWDKASLSKPVPPE